MLRDQQVRYLAVHPNRSETIEQIELVNHMMARYPETFELALTADDWRELMPTEDFTLRVSRVPVRLPEDDLFAGLR